MSLGAPTADSSSHLYVEAQRLRKEIDEYRLDINKRLTEIQVNLSEVRFIPFKQAILAELDSEHILTSAVGSYAQSIIGDLVGKPQPDGKLLPQNFLERGQDIQRKMFVREEAFNDVNSRINSMGHGGLQNCVSIVKDLIVGSNDKNMKLRSIFSKMYPMPFIERVEGFLQKPVLLYRYPGHKHGAAASAGADPAIAVDHSATSHRSRSRSPH